MKTFKCVGTKELYRLGFEKALDGVAWAAYASPSHTPYSNHFFTFKQLLSAIVANNRAHEAYKAEKYNSEHIVLENEEELKNMIALKEQLEKEEIEIVVWEL